MKNDSSMCRLSACHHCCLVQILNTDLFLNWFFENEWKIFKMSYYIDTNQSNRSEIDSISKLLIIESLMNAIFLLSCYCAQVIRWHEIQFDHLLSRHICLSLQRQRTSKIVQFHIAKLVETKGLPVSEVKVAKKKMSFCFLCNWLM